MVSVGIVGNAIASLNSGKATLRKICFGSTSYKEDVRKTIYLIKGVKLYIVFCLLRQRGNILSEHEVIFSRISSPIYVTSRRAAHLRNFQTKNSIEGFLKLFEMSVLKETFITKSIKNTGKSTPKVVSNNIEGLINYLSAANLRKKVKHPLFLALKFSNCFSILLPEETINFTVIDYLKQGIRTFAVSAN